MERTLTVLKKYNIRAPLIELQGESNGLTFNGSKVLTLSDQTGASTTVIPVVDGTAQTSATKTINLSLNTTTADWITSTGSQRIDGLSTPDANTIRFTKPGIYKCCVFLNFAQTVSSTVYAFVNGVQNDFSSQCISTALAGGSPSFGMKYDFVIVYGPGNTGNLDVTFAVQATNVSGGAAADYSLSYVYLTRFMHQVTV